MYSLFWKIFFTFWVIILFIELFTAWVTADLSESELHPILEQENLEFIASSTEAVSILTSRGLNAFQRWSSVAGNLQGVDNIYVVNEEDEEINNQQLPANIQAIVNRGFDETPVDHYQPIKHILTFQTNTPGGNKYLVVSTFAHPPLLRYLFAPQRVMLSVIISGIICFLLARYFTKPLSNLRRSTQKLTLGEFDTTSLQELRNRNDEFGALAVEFDFMSKRLGNLLESQRQLLRDISHELNSPLARIRVAIELARNKYKDEEGSELDRIEREIGRLEFLIRELLTFVKIESLENLPEMTKVDVQQMLNQIVDDAKFEREHSPVEQKIVLNCEGGVALFADARLMHRAIENIVRNACYYSPRNAQITINCHSDGFNVSITIEDQGPGVPDDMLGKIFQPFVRVSSARETDTGGSGIGLAIAKRVIDIHKGSVTARNKPANKGLIVSITLPVYSENSSQSAA